MATTETAQIYQLTAERGAILAAAVARILPSDDGPGAREARAEAYIENALGDRWHRDFVALFERGLDFFQALAQRSHGKDFVACGPAEQDDILDQAQDFPNNDARRFFDRLVHLTLEGFLCHPSHGGNHRGLGWHYVGFEPEALAPGRCSQG